METFITVLVLYILSIPVVAAFQGLLDWLNEGDIIDSLGHDEFLIQYMKVNSL